MKRTRRRDTSAEMVIRRELHARGFRYFVDYAIEGVPRIRPDIVFPRRKVAVMVDGCFWHSCPAHATIPKANREWWVQKLSANRARDARATALLEDAGWKVIRIWEHEDPDVAVDRIAAAVDDARASP